MALPAALASLPERDWQTTDDVEPLRIAVVGLGRYARGRALPAIDDADFCTATAVVSGTPATAERIADEHGVDTVLTYGEFADGVASDAYDAVYVATPNARHLPHVETATELGKHVLCEKPLETTPERARAAVEACEDAGVRLLVDYRMQADPVARCARELVREGVIGDPVKLHAEFSIDVLAGDRSPDQWRLDADLAGGGALVDVGVYGVNTGRFLLDADPVAVSGTTASPEPAFDEVEQHVTAWLAFEGDQRPAGAVTASYRAHLEDSLQVLGTEGQLRIESAFGTQTDRPLVVERGDERVTHEEPATDEIVELFDYFAHAVRTGEPADPDGRDGLRDVAVMAAIYQSATSGERVEL